MVESAGSDATIGTSIGKGRAMRRGFSSRTKLIRIVGIGASAGGLEAFTDLLRHLPTDAGVAYVLVQHLDPTHRSLLSELLARVTTLPVKEIENNSRVEANQIYVIPPNCDLRVENGVLKLSTRKKNAGPARSIDHFLKSLAEDQKENGIAVILSGAGSDGAQGLKAVKAAGGLTFAQDEATAKYNSMPRSAAATGCVDFVLSPEKIAEEIARFIRKPKATKGRAAANARRRTSGVPETSAQWSQRLAVKAGWPAPPADINLRKIFLQIRTKTGIDFTFYKMSTIRRRLARRMAANKIKSLEAYSRFLRENPNEADALYQDCLINVTTFFRNPGAFEVLKRKIFPRLARNYSGPDPIRFWVAGCSTGQEPYSLAMAYTEFVEQSSMNPPIQIFATDVNGSVLDRARTGRYTKSQVEGLSSKRLNRFFTTEDGHYRVIKSIRDMVVFAQHDLLVHPPFTKVELITCRNLLIYLEQALQQRILPTFHYALKPDGFLWLGSSESIGQFTSLFTTLDKTHRIYQRKAAASWLRVDRPPLVPAPARTLPSFSAVNRPAEFNVLDAQKEADRVTLAKYTPASILVNNDLEILQFRGDTSNYLTLPTGKASFNLLKMAREGLTLPLQRILARAKDENRVAREKGVRFGARGNVVNLEVVPLKNLNTPCFLVFFEKPPRIPGLSKVKEVHGSGNGKGKKPVNVSLQARQEVAELREKLQSIQEENETAVEELQASNEEVQSSNEELQSLNEELETSNEELESANEELTTLNEELATRNAELRESEQRLREQAQLLDMAPILARSPKDRIIFWSGGAEVMYGFTKDEAVGQSAHLLLNTHFYEPLDHIQAKLMREGHWEGEVQHRRKDGRIIDVFAKWVLHRDADNKPRAILEVNADITARKQAETALRASEEFTRSILDSSPDCMKALDRDGRVIFINPGCLGVMELDDPAAEINTYWPGLWTDAARTHAEEAIKLALSGKTGRFRGFSPTAKGTPKWWDVAVSPIFGTHGKPERLLAAHRDITEHMRAEETLAEQARLHALRAAIAVTIADSKDAAATFQKIAEHFVQHLDAAAARIWTLTQQQGVFEAQGTAGIHQQSESVPERVAMGESSIGRIAQQCIPLVTKEVQNDPGMCDSAWAKREKLAMFVGYPLVASGTPVGILGIFLRRPVSAAIREEISFAANSIAQFLQRQQSEGMRQEAQERLNRYAEDLEKRVEERTITLKQIIGELEAFSYSVSHDLRTPLRAMEGYAKAILEDIGNTLNDEHRGFLQRIVRGASRLDRLTLDVLAYSRISRTDFTVQPVDLEKLIHDIIEQYPHFQSAKDQIELQSPLLPVLGHEAFLTQCISNLVGNALKFVAPGRTPQVRISTEARDGKVRLNVEDNGIGISPDHRERVFQMFGRIHADKKYEGSGIGLAVVRRAVERMGGTVDFESQPGVGSRFWIELPAAPA